MTPIAAFLLLVTVLAIHAGWRGGAPERLAAAAMLVATIATSLTNMQGALAFRDVQWSIVWIDAALLAALLAIALRANRFWPLWVAAIQCLALAAHAARAFDADILPLAYWWVVGKLSYPMLLLLIVGTERHHRRRRQGHRDPAWSLASQ
ncbi:hypothetical protein CG471_12830 [Sphingobium sp. IP1]|uniref:hypothetical protein n=1 Tax=Sphingobium sp. IP1 TaxID=2021637 RepID=UPI000C08468E|nr:hypothetical protein [Sphingobium sp. IP1]PHP19310.1 hypothetical protein CG471_12830 [Sphingobium sp. IP1]